jgi:gamma-glutamyl:cysteine ligase YbdK (ATP-grasp superfamily)
VGGGGGWGGVLGVTGSFLPVGHAGQDVGMGVVGIGAHPVVPAHVLHIQQVAHFQDQQTRQHHPCHRVVRLLMSVHLHMELNAVRSDFLVNVFKNISLRQHGPF